MQRPDDFKQEIGGEQWSVIFVRRGHTKLRGSWGICYRDSRQIYVRYDLSRDTVMDILIHEILHATCPLLFCAEAWVDQTASEIAKAVSRL